MKEEQKTIKQRLIEIQSILKAPKNRYNSFGKYNYRDAEGILEAVKPLLHERGLMIKTNELILWIGERYYIQSEVIVSDDTGEERAIGLAREADKQSGMNESQLTGSTSSYAKKYALNNMFAIDDTKDSDATNTHGKDSPTEAAKSPPKELPILTKDHPSYSAVKGYISSTRDTVLAMQNSRTKFNISAEVEKELLKTK